MFGSLIPIVYVTISPERLTLKNLRTGVTIAEPPELAITKTSPPKIIGVGSQARIAGALQPSDIVNPFSHPRSLVSDFIIGEQLIKRQLNALLSKGVFSPSPTIIIHPLGNPEGGFTEVEKRAFCEMAAGAGGSKVHFKIDQPLTEQEIEKIIKESW